MVGLYIAAILIALVVIWISRRRESRTTSIPSQPGLPFVGNAFQLDPTGPHKTLTEWSKKRGAIFKIKLFGKEVIVLNDFDTIYEALVRKGEDFSSRDQLKGPEVRLCTYIHTLLVMPCWKVRSSLISTQSHPDSTRRRGVASG